MLNMLLQRIASKPDHYSIGEIRNTHPRRETQNSHDLPVRK